ncbi:MAG: choice-of-anchor Q domain-containing protein [Chloroflexota bacterium]
MNRKLNLANVIISVLVGLTLLFSAVQPVSVSASDSFIQDGIRRSVHPQTGKLSFLGADPTNPLRVERAMERGLSPEMRGKAILDVYGREFGLKNAEEELRFTSSHENDGRGTVKYQQVYQGIPILAGELIVNTNAQGALLSINGEVSPDLNLSTKPNVDSARATGIALSEIASAYRLATSELTISEPALWIYDARLLNGNDKTPAHLVWRMEVTSENAPLRELVLVNAQNGKISLHFNQIDTAWTGNPSPAKDDAVNPATVPAAEPIHAPATGLNMPLGDPDPSLSLFVASTGTDDNGNNTCTDSANPCATINHAISQASDGQAIGVTVGTYTGSGTEVVLINKSVNLSGGWNATFDAQTGYSIVDGMNSQNGIIVTDQGAGLLTVSIENVMVFKTLWWGILNNENLTIARSSIHSNMHDGIRHGNGELLLENSTVSSNKNYGLYISSGTVNLNYVTISDHVTPYYPGIYKYTGVLNFKNTIMFNGNGGVSNSECWSMAAGDFNSLGHNVIGTTCGGAIEDPTDKFETDPNLGVFLPLQGYHPILSDSPAIDTGDTSCDVTDQRGVSRIDIDNVGDLGISCDIGAYEYTVPGPAASVWAVSGDNQHTEPNSEFPEPLRAVVLDAQGSPVSNAGVTFTAPTSGPTGVFGNGTYEEVPLSDESGVATTSLITANPELGTFVVQADAGLGTTVDFTLENLIWYVSPSGSDVNSCKSPEEPCATINGAINKASNGDSIFVAIGVYVGSGTEVVLINKSLTLSGGWDETFTSQTGHSTIDGQDARLGIRNASKSSIDHFIITNGYSNDLGGGIYNGSSAELTIISIRVHGNYSRSWGGGIRNEGTMVLSNSVVYQNSSYTGGGGIYSIGTLTINNSTIAQNENMGIRGDTIVINNSTITENSGGTAGGMWAYDTEIKNSIVANNTGSAPDCYGSVTSKDYNIVGDTTSCTLDTTSAGHDQLNVDPGLTVFFAGVGYYSLQPTSPAVDAGNPATAGSGGDACLSEDQRGASRVQNGNNGVACDIGAYEYTSPGTPASISIIDGSPQVASPNTAFSLPLRVAVFDAQGSPVPDAVVNFEAPATGASGTFTNNQSSATTDLGGLATSSEFTANDQVGSYLVSASVQDLPDMVNFSLHNGSWMVAPTGNDSNDCVTPLTPCATIQGVLNKPHFADGNEIWVAVGLYNTSDHVYVKKSVSLKGGWDATFTSQIGASMLEDAIITSSGTNVSIEKFTIQNTLLSIGIYKYGVHNNGIMTISNSTIKNNKGGIENRDTLTVVNSTITDNYYIYSPLSGYGSGIYGASGTTTLINVTVTNNSASVGGGIYTDSGGGEFVLMNTIIAGNFAGGSGSGFDCHAKVISHGYNLIGEYGGIAPWNGEFAWNCQGNWNPMSDIVGTHEKPALAHIGALTDLGNGVWIRPLNPGSPAIDNGNSLPPESDDYACAEEDQIGTARPQGSACDMGAVEYLHEIHPPEALLVTFDAGNTTSLPGTEVCSGDTGACAGDVHERSAHNYAYSTYSWYQTWHGRNSIDGNGMQILSSVHYGSGYKNAFWSGSSIVYGDGYAFAKADDVVAHEYTHGVTQYESGLFPWYQSGAISESFSDLWGEAVDQYNKLGNDVATVKWLIGEDVTGLGAVRNMKNPPAYKQPDSVLSSLYCESGDCIFKDQGGIHTNSGVNNKAAYLLVAGGTFRNRTVKPLGWPKVLTIYYEAQTNLLTSGSDYLDLYNSLYQACLNKIGTKGIVLDNCNQVRNATLAVGMNLEPAAGFNPDADLCPTGMVKYKDLFFDDFEAGLNESSWKLGAYPGIFKSISVWELSGKYSYSGSNALWANDSYHINDSYAAMSKRVLIPSGAKTYLHFAHSYTLGIYYNETYAGGVVEYSLNNGVNWRDLKPLFNAGQNYNRTITLQIQNPLQGRYAFTGDSHGFVDSRYDLSSLVGKYVQIQWRLGTSGIPSTIPAILGWTVDDVHIYTCLYIPSKPTLLKPLNGSKVTTLKPLLDWTDSTPSLDHYELQIAENSTFTIGRVSNNTLKTSYFRPLSDLVSGKTYYWRVRAFNAAGKASAWSTVWSFTTP